MEPSSPAAAPAAAPAPASSPAYPPETLEGWFALHQLFAIDRGALRGLAPQTLQDVRCSSSEALQTLMADQASEADGWSAIAPLVGSTADVLFMHFRPSLDALADAQDRVGRMPLIDFLRPVSFFLSVTELGLYQLAAHGSDDPKRAERIRAERESPHTLRRLYPALPAGMPYVSFYPMSKRRDAGQNWYTLPLQERSRLMQSHGLTGRRYAGRVLQIITGAIGLDRWEWGVTLFAKDPVDFKKLVTEMRFDEVSAKYAEFGDFYVGRITEPEHWVQSLGA
jgi:hydrogen peroxide-dependent heme synthase